MGRKPTLYPMSRNSLKINSIPERYTLRNSEEGSFLSCLESPNISVSIKFGRVIPQAQARKAADRTIFLDGAASGEPFMDPEHHVYNMDHHEGCVRSFTLATCEQAAVLVMKGLDLSEKTWQIKANDPDLDTVLAIWVLLNHNRFLDEDRAIVKRIMPLLRLEGLIDAQGLELQSLSGFPDSLQDENLRKIDYLRREENRLKKEGSWETINHASYTLDLLGKIDELVYHPSTFQDFKGLEELAREEVEGLTSIVVYRTELGVYEVEELLKRLYRNRPGIVIVERNQGNYTIRKTDLFLPVELDHLYRRLNRMDPMVRGKDPDNRWGGSGDIGGSPRKTGTGLDPESIVTICRESVEKKSNLEKGVRFLWAAFIGSVLPGLFWLFSRLVLPFLPGDSILQSPNFLLSGFAIAQTFLFLLLYRAEMLEFPWFFGFRSPSGKDWWFVLPLLPLGAVLNGLPVFQGVFLQDPGSFLAGILLLPVTLELLYRGTIHGMLSEDAEIQRTGGSWFISFPAVGSSLIYAAALLFYPLPSRMPEFIFPGSFLLMEPIFRFSGGFLTGLVFSFIRERSDSVVPSVMFHVLFALVFSFLAFVIH